MKESVYEKKRMCVCKKETEIECGGMDGCVGMWGVEDAGEHMGENKCVEEKMLIYGNVCMRVCMRERQRERESMSEKMNIRVRENLNDRIYVSDSAYAKGKNMCAKVKMCMEDRERMCVIVFVRV